MPKMSQREIEQRLNTIHSRYTFRFAGHPRATRDLNELDTILADARKLSKKARSLQRHRTQEVRDLLKERIALYEREREAIVELLSGGPQVRAASVLGSTANLIHARYRRHFAGQSRSTRDMALLDEMRDDMQAVRDAMIELSGEFEDNALARDLEIVNGHLELYTAEREAIVETQTEGTAQEQADLLAALANNQFEVYRTHFAGRERLTRRPGLLMRLQRSLRHVLGRMNQLKTDGLDNNTHNTNIRVVTERLEVYGEELEAIEVARSRANTTDLILNLGHAANTEMAEYREHYAGKDRATRDLVRLSQICDRLGEIERQMRSIDQESPGESATNARNLSLVRDHMRVYEGEYDRIVEARASSQN